MGQLFVNIQQLTTSSTITTTTTISATTVTSILTAPARVTTTMMTTIGAGYHNQGWLPWMRAGRVREQVQTLFACGAASWWSSHAALFAPSCFPVVSIPSLEASLMVLPQYESAWTPYAASSQFHTTYKLNIIIKYLRIPPSFNVVIKIFLYIKIQSAWPHSYKIFGLHFTTCTCGPRLLNSEQFGLCCTALHNHQSVTCEPLKLANCWVDLMSFEWQDVRWCRVWQGSNCNVSAKIWNTSELHSAQPLDYLSQFPGSLQRLTPVTQWTTLCRPCYLIL